MAVDLDTPAAFLDRAGMDANKWAHEFIRMFGDKRDQIDGGLMLAWFANAIMAGWDHAHWKLEPEIESLRSTIAQMKAEIEEYRASKKCKEETVIGEGRGRHLP